MGFKVVLSPRAIDDLRDIVVHVTAQRPEAARRLGLALVDRTKLLEAHPFAGRIVPEFNNRLIRELICAPYRIVHRVDERSRTIGVARYWHSARGDLNWQDVR